MVTYEYFKFLNLQYWYCIVYSIFGGRCTVVDTPSATVPTTTLSANPPGQSIGFWEWLFGGGGGAYTGPFAVFVNAFSGLFSFFGSLIAILWGIFSILSYSLSGLLVLLITGSALGLLLIRYSELSTYGNLPPESKTALSERSRWQILLDGAMAPDPKRWRESILEADVMLGEVLLKLGYPGATTHERLRSVPEGAFVTLPNAWEAHRIRNFVSARSSDYILTQREAFRVMKLYEQVFEEFDYV